MVNSEFRLSVFEVCLVIRNIPIALAKKIINLNGYNCRIALEDGVRFPLGSDLRDDRITVSVLSGIVVEADAL